MGTRTANGTGNMRKRPNGTWEARLSYVDGDGTLKRVSVYGKTQREVREKTKAVRDRVDNGAPANDDKMALAAWMARWRETTLAASDRKEATRSLYATLSRKHIEAGVIGLVSLAKLRPSDVEKLILDMRSRKPAKLSGLRPSGRSTACCAWAWTVPCVMGCLHATRQPQCSDQASHARKRHTSIRSGSRSYWQPLRAPGITRRCC